MTKEPRYITITKAIEVAAVRDIALSRPTLIRWCQLYGIGHQLGGWHGRWVIYPKKFKDVLDGKCKEKETKRTDTEKSQ